MLISWKICFKKAVIFEVVMLPADYKRRIGMSKTETLLNASGINLCVLDKGYAYPGRLEEKNFATGPGIFGILCTHNT